MQFKYEGLSNLPAIYKITNTHTNRVYIGQAKTLKLRWSDHASSLRSNKHQNKFIQNDFNKCLAELGHEDFLVFSVLEVMKDSTKEQRNKREEELIQEHYDNQHFCYNFKDTVCNGERSCRSNTPEETRLKASVSMMQVWASKTDEERQLIADKISKAQKGTKHSPERIEANSLAHLGQPAWNKGLTGTQAGSNHPMFGKHHTEEAKLKNSQAHKGKIPWNKGLKLTSDRTSIQQ